MKNPKTREPTVMLTPFQIEERKATEHYKKMQNAFIKKYDYRPWLKWTEAEIKAASTP